MRKLVTLRTIGAIHPIKNADRIEEITVDGWSLVCQKGLHEVGAQILFFEIDCFLPESDERFASFMAFGTNVLEGVRGHRVRTKRLKKVYSQGIIMPISEFPEIEDPEEDVDYSELCGVVKYERPEVTGFQGNAKDTWPSFLRKSSQERIQNCYGRLQRDHMDEVFIADLKMDGSSITVFDIPEDADSYFGDRGPRLCSRNQEIKYDPEVDGAEQGKFVDGAARADLFLKAKELNRITGKLYALQGELVGEGIQGTFEKFEANTVFVYNIFDIMEGEFVDYNTFVAFVEKLDIQSTPLIKEPAQWLTHDLDAMLKFADGPSIRAPYREGLVFKSITSNKQFKVISNKYLNKEE